MVVMSISYDDGSHVSMNISDYQLMEETYADAWKCQGMCLPLLLLLESFQSSLTGSAPAAVLQLGSLLGKNKEAARTFMPSCTFT